MSIVKPLEWTQKAPAAHDHEPFVYWACGLGGWYRAERDGMLWYAHDEFVWDQFPSQKDAKAAAEADHQKRMLSEICVDFPDAGRVKQLEEALRPFVDAADAMDFIRGNPDEVFIWGESGGESPRTISVSDLRRARARLNGGSNASE